MKAILRVFSLIIKGVRWYTYPVLINTVKTRAEITETHPKSYKSSDVLYVLGSGGSIKDIKKQEWNRIGKSDTLGFNWFHKLEFIPVTYYIVREVANADNKKALLQNDALKEYHSNLKKASYAQSLLLVNKHMYSSFYALKKNYFKGRDLFFYKNKFPVQIKQSRLLGESFSQVFHDQATLNDAINFGYLLGYKKIVLVGVDLYDSQYFWLKKGEARDDGTVDKPKATSKKHSTFEAVVQSTKQIQQELTEAGVKLYVYNPKSALAQFLPVWKS